LIGCRRQSSVARQSIAEAAHGPGSIEEPWIHVAKLTRAHGGCLGVRRLRRAWKTAISLGELSYER
jgi:hypothetical protein